MKVFYTLFIFGLLALCHSAPLQDLNEQDPELTPGYFEGDIILDSQRNGLRNTNYRWPNKIVYYRINSNHFDAAHRNHILRGMRNIEAVSCIRFQEAPTGQRAYVEFTGVSGGCYSSVGYLNRAQTLNLEVYPLDSGCFRIGTIMHEILHTLGFYHMQSSSDRDDFVYIDQANIQSGTLNNFNKYSVNTVDDFGERYDYGSVMHYSAYAFSANGKMTIVPLEKEAANIMGQRTQMSKSDINRLNLMYRCPLET